MTGRRHYTKVVVPLQPPVIECGMPRVVEGKILYPRPPTGRFESRLSGPDLPPLRGERLYSRQAPLGMALDIAAGSR